MKKIIRKWLGLDEEYKRLSGAILEIDTKINKCQSELEFVTGDIVKPNTTKEIVYAILKHFRLRPITRFEEKPSQIQTSTIERILELKKIK